MSPPEKGNPCRSRLGKGSAVGGSEQFATKGEKSLRRKGSSTANKEKETTVFEGQRRGRGPEINNCLANRQGRREPTL